MAGDTVISAAVEGSLDEAVMRRLIVEAGAIPGPVYGKQGKAYLRQKINGFRNASRWSPWIVLVDLDHDFDCAPPLCREWIPQTARNLCFRVAVREVESWLLADTEGLATFLAVPRSMIPACPEELQDPKAAMVQLARGSRSRAIREDMVPRQEGGREIGPAYSSRLIEFASSTWNPSIAAQHSDSLRRTIARLNHLVESA